jgi:plastocyanin domain-containing protein
MDTAQIVVTAGGVLLIGFILWFFFGRKGATAAREASGGVQEVDVTVRGAYTPDRIEVEAGRPVRLLFTREEANSCTEQVILPDFGLVRDLPLGKKVPLEFTPEAPGEYTFHCGMNMVRGRVVVREAKAG